MADYNQLGNIGKNGTNEFFETLIMMTAYDFTRGIIADFTEDMDDGALKEAYQGAMSVIAFGAVAFLISVEEEVMDAILSASKAKAVAIIAFGRGVGDRLHNKYKGRKGRLTYMASKVGSSLRSDSAQIANVVSNYAIADSTGKNSKNGSYGSISTVQDTKKSVIDKEGHNLNIAKAMQDSLQSSSIIKVLSSSFTERDVSMLKKVTNNPEFNISKTEDLNSLSQAMFSFDSENNRVTLSESFVSLVNSTGYFHNLRPQSTT